MALAEVGWRVVIFLVSFGNAALLILTAVVASSRVSVWPLVGFVLLYNAVLGTLIAVRFGTDATKQDILEEVTGLDLDTVSGKELVNRFDREDGNAVRQN
jgi:hypothetical protein